MAISSDILTNLDVMEAYHRLQLEQIEKTRKSLVGKKPAKTMSKAAALAVAKRISKIKTS